MKKFIIIFFILSLSSPISACIIDQLVAETNNGVSWPAAGPKWGQSFVACEDGDVWEIAFYPHYLTAGLHTLILTDINCVTMWTVNNINFPGTDNPITVDLATGSGTSRSVISGSSYIFQIIGPAGSNLQMWLSWVDPYPPGEDKTDGCASYGLDWWFRVSIDEPLSPLPIKLSAFDAKVIEKGTAVELNFETESEIGASHFVIENANEDEQFTEIGKINAAGNSNSLKAYQFFHQNPEKGNNYYRLKQVDEDGSFEYSKVVHVQIKSHVFTHRIFPNPTQGDIEISFTQPGEKELSFYLFNLNGEILSSQQLISETTSITFDGSNLPPGIYIIQAVDNRQLLWIEKIIKY